MKKNPIQTTVWADGDRPIAQQVAQACSAFIVGKDLTTGWLHAVWSYRGLSLCTRWWAPQSKLCCSSSKGDYKEGDKIEDESNGFTYPLWLMKWSTQRPMMQRVAMVAMVTLELTVLMKWACRWQRQYQRLLMIRYWKPTLWSKMAYQKLPWSTWSCLVAKTAREGIEIVAQDLGWKGSAEGEYYRRSR